MRRTPRCRTSASDPDRRLLLTFRSTRQVLLLPFIAAAVVYGGINAGEGCLAGDRENEPPPTPACFTPAIRGYPVSREEVLPMNRGIIGTIIGVLVIIILVIIILQLT